MPPSERGVAQYSLSGRERDGSLSGAIDRGPRLFESLEAVSLGIDGKSGRWRVLATLTSEVPDVGGRDYDTLILRAADQRQRAEALRLEVARVALSDGGTTE
jgi:hypothetical protein